MMSLPYQKTDRSTSSNSCFWQVSLYMPKSGSFHTIQSIGAPRMLSPIKLDGSQDSKKRCRHTSRTAIYSLHNPPGNLIVFFHSSFIGNTPHDGKVALLLPSECPCPRLENLGSSPGFRGQKVDRSPDEEWLKASSCIHGFRLIFCQFSPAVSGPAVVFTCSLLPTL